MRGLFSLSFREPGSAQRCYFDLLRRTAGVKVPYERRRERF
jgi:hypothetical protein